MNAPMERALLALGGAAMALAFLAAIGTPMPRLIGTGCASYPSLQLAHEESELPRCRTIKRLPWAKG